MPTDSPANAIACVLEDKTAHAPRFVIGLKAHRNLGRAVEKSMLEAMRARTGIRRMLNEENQPALKPAREVGHYDRLHYWALPENSRKLEFLIAGKVQDLRKAPWENDDEQTHLARVIAWCKEKNFECVSIPLTHSKFNPSSLYIEMVVMPDLQPTHLPERDIALGGDRWRTMVEACGYQSRKSIFDAEPHPFA